MTSVPATDGCKGQIQESCLTPVSEYDITRFPETNGAVAMSAIDALRVAEKRAKLAWVQAQAKVLAAELEAAHPPPLPTDAGQLSYTPSWKIAGRPHLSKDGERAILTAYDQGMRPAEVARLFRITERAAANWRHRWQNPQKAAG
jgi:hypothetical protein